MSSLSPREKLAKASLGTATCLGLSCNCQQVSLAFVRAPCQAALADDVQRTGLKAGLAEDWERRSSTFLQDEVPKIDGKLDQPSLCQQLGTCVCKGEGAVALHFVKKITAMLKPIFTPLRKKKKGANGPDLDPALTPAGKQLKQNRKLLQDGMIFLKLSKHAETMPPEEDASLGVLGASWKAVVSSVLSDQPCATFAAAENKGSDVADSLWLHIGYINFQTWACSFLRLESVGAPDERGIQRLEVQGIHVRQAVLAVLKLLGESGLQLAWDMEVYTIHVDKGCIVQGEDVRPNWVLVKKFVPNVGPNPESTFACFWQGSDLEEQKKKTARAKQRKPKSTPAGRKEGSHVPSYSFASRAKSKRQRALEDHRTDPAPLGWEQGDQENDQDLQDFHLESDSAASVLFPSESEASDFAEQAPNTGKTNPPQASSSTGQEATSSSRAAASAPSDSLLLPDETPLAELFTARVARGNVLEALDSEIKGGAATEDEPAKRRRLGEPVARDPPSGPDLSVSCGPYTDLRYNFKSKTIIAVCKHPGHGDCRRSRTTQGPVRQTARSAGQGRPVGLLMYFLQRGEDCADGAAHKKILDSPAVPITQEQRLAARRVFQSLPHAEHILKYERVRAAGEGDEPEFMQ